MAAREGNGGGYLAGGGRKDRRRLCPELWPGLPVAGMGKRKDLLLKERGDSKGQPGYGNGESNGRNGRGRGRGTAMVSCIDLDSSNCVTRRKKKGLSLQPWPRTG